MCGIVGIVGKEADNVSFENKLLSLKSLKHRGPDNEDFYENKNIFLGHTRLAIIDLDKKSNQPMFDHTKRYIIVFNGEIYNYKTVKEQLIKLGHKFKTKSDTEVILEAYKEYGTNCDKYFNGAWAFGIYDKKNSSLFMSRDRIGEKPLYYHIKNNTIYFSSELPTLLNFKNVSTDINVKALTHFMSYNVRHIPWDMTIFKDIEKLPPAHNLLFNFKTGHFTVNRYWFPTFKKDMSITEKNVLERYSDVLYKAVNETATSDVPIGLLLSGGIDSSSIAFALNNKSITAYTIGVDENDEEVKRAKIVADKLNMKHKIIKFSSDEIVKNGPRDLRKIIRQLGEPINLVQPLFTYHILKQVKKDKIKVLIGGNGADELYYGYSGAKWSLLVTKIYNVLNKINFLQKYLTVNHINYNQIKLNRYKNDFEKYSKVINLFNPIHLTYSPLYKLSKLCDSKNFIEHAQWLGLCFENEHSITIVNDVGGMMNSVEIRTPFLNKDFMEFSFKLPLKYKIRSVLSDKTNKWIMKKFAVDKIDKELFNRPKLGFGSNIKLSKLLKNEWHEDVRKVVIDYLPSTKVFDTQFIFDAYNQHMFTDIDRTKDLFALYTFGIWHQEFVRGKKNGKK